MSRPARVGLLMALATLAVQLAWAFTLAPFRGIDEFDHAFRSAGVAHGQWLPSDRPVEDGRGSYVQAPRSLVEAATAVCSSYGYTGPANCRPGADVGEGYVEVASAAGRYHPLAYALTGWPTLLLDGAAALYALRLLTAVLTAALFGLAGYALAVAHRSAWPLLGLVAALSPVVLYSGAVPAPNGPEMAAAALLWSALVGLRAAADAATRSRLVALAAAGAVLLVSLRTLGPLWLALIVLTCLPVVGRARMTLLWREHRRGLVAATGSVLLAGLAALAWLRAAAPNSLGAEEDLGLPDPLLSTLREMPLWVLQSLAAFPVRNEPAPTGVYGAAAGVLLVVLLAVSRGAPRRWYAVALALVVVWLAVPFVITLLTYSRLGGVWQGRYALPYGLGIPIVLTALGAGWTRRPARSHVVLVAVLTAGLAHAWSVLGVYATELRTSVVAGSPDWVTPPPWVVAVVVVGGTVAMLAAVSAAQPTPGPPPRPSADRGAASGVRARGRGGPPAGVLR